MTELGHLLVADRLFRDLQWPEQMRAAMYLGCIAPDAYRVTTEVDYRQVHFRSPRTPGLRLTDFLRTYLRPALAGRDPDARAFYTGWLSHICTDYVWRQKIRSELPELWRIVTEAPKLEGLALKHQFYDECDWVDVQLHRAEPERLEQIGWLLGQAPVLYAIPPLQFGDIHRWRQQVIQEMLPPANYTVQIPRLLSVEFVQGVIAQAHEEAFDMLSWEAKLAGGEEEE